MPDDDAANLSTDVLFDYARYLFELRQNTILPHTIADYVNAVALHVKRESGVVLHKSQAMCDWLHRLQQLPRPHHFKDPAPRSLIQSIVFDETESLGLRVACLLQWHLTLRAGQLVASLVGDFNEHAVLRRDVVFAEDGTYAQVLLVKGKNDVYNSGSFRYLMAAAKDAPFCPVRMLRRYMDHTDAKCHFAAEAPLLRHDDGRLVTYDHMRKCVKRHARRLGLDEDAFATHSGRSGPATALGEAGFDIDTIMLQGYWATLAGCQRYVRMTAERAQKIAGALSLGVDGISDAGMVLPSRPRRSAR
jgi:hypothetical protein